MEILDGAEVSLFADSKFLSKPIHMNFGSDGKLWVATSETYPQIKPGQVANDKIVVLQDTNNDGKCDKSTVFADGLLIPTGILPDIATDKGQGVYVACSTKLIYFRDTDGDDVADEQKIVLEGFGTEDTHHLLHTLRWGPDGCIYLNQSIYIHSHVPTRFGTKHLNGGGIWRFDPRTDQLTILCKGFVNPWGHAITSSGQSFVTDGAYYEGINHVFPGAVFATSPGATRVLKGMNPGSPKHCGLELLHEDSANDSMELVTADFRSHRVNRFKVSKTDSGYSSIALPDLIRSEHVAFRPIDMKLAPTGELFIADWYNPIIQHGEVDFRDARRDTTNGRIWRVKLADHPPSSPNFVSRDQSVQTALETLQSDDLQRKSWTRLLLADRWSDDLSEQLSKWVNEAADNSERAKRLLQKHWIAAAVGALTQEQIEPLLVAGDPQIRAAGLRLIGDHFVNEMSSIEFAERMISDSDWLVRLEAIALLQRIADTGKIGCLPIALQALEQPVNDEIDFALWQLVGTESTLTDREWLIGINAKQVAFLLNSNTNLEIKRIIVDQVLNRELVDVDASILSVIASTGDDDSIDRLAEKFIVELNRSNNIDSNIWSLLRSFASGLKPKPKPSPSALNRLLSLAILRSDEIQPSDTAAMENRMQSIASLIAVVKDESTLPWLGKSLEIADSPTTIAALTTALSSLGPNGAAMLESIGASSQSSTSVRVASINSLATLNVNAASRRAIELLDSVDELNGSRLNLRPVFTQKKSLSAIQQSIAKTTTLKPSTARTLLALMRDCRLDDASLLDQIASLGQLDQHRWKITPEFVAQIRARIADGLSNANQGETIYRQESLKCVQCHKIGSAGGDIGPNLISLGGSSQIDYVIESLIEPNAKLKEGFKTVVALTDQDKIVTGLERSRTEDQLSLQTAEGQMVHLELDSIIEERDGGSLMPAGLVDRLTIDQLADLVDFLSQLGRTRDFTVSSDRWIRNWKYLRNTTPMIQFLNRQGIDKLADRNDEMQWQPVTAHVSGLVQLSETDKLQPHSSQSPIQVVESTIDCKKSGNIVLKIESDHQFNLYVDGKAALAENEIYLTTGLHRIVITVLSDGNGELGCQVKDAMENPAIVEIAKLIATENSGPAIASSSGQTRKSWLVAQSTEGKAKISLTDGDVVAIVGDDLWEQIGRHAVFETQIRLANRDKSLRFRNMAWAGDDVSGQAQALFGETKDGYERRLSQIKSIAPTQVVVCFGRNEAIDSKWTIDGFIKQYSRFLDDLVHENYRITVALPPLSLANDTHSSEINENIKNYNAAIQKLCDAKNLPHVELPPIQSNYLIDGFRLSSRGLTALSIDWADLFVDFDDKVQQLLPSSQDWIKLSEANRSNETLIADSSGSIAKIYRLVRQKEDEFFYAIRPQNETYLLLFRKHEQGNNAVDLDAFRELAAKTDIEIDRSLQDAKSSTKLN